MKAPSNPWAGRFREGMSDRLVRFNTSLPIETRLFEADVRASMAHVSMLSATGLLTAEEGAALERGLGAIREEWLAGRIELDPELEDIHMNLEMLLTQRLGEVGKKVHTARSRNDQQAAAQRIFFKESTLHLAERVKLLERTLLDHCKRHGHLVMPSYTHLQRAEFTSYAHWASTYVVMLDRDRTRLLDGVRRADECPLGGCASTGSSLGIDRWKTATQLGFRRPTMHSIDSVSDRDYLVEFTAHAALLMVHLSRFAEEIIIFTSQEFGFLRLADAYCTGSSIMPQKKNPDVLELVRGKAATAMGDAMSLLALVKNLTLGYNKDVQEDKTSWFSALDACVSSVDIMSDIVRTMEPVAHRMREATRSGHILATEYANYLVRRGLPFREAHHVVGELVRKAEDRGVDVSELELAELRAACPHFADDVRELTIEGVIRGKNSAGSCGSEAMARLYDELESLLDEPKENEQGTKT
ncbi:argininosuccinate lyase [Pendulispora brunnea]|uniref:Argininosuccinate lyase n=1 Tax=Pendulispora brunnea TaxID=2905690 RepID=A0ABZ2KJ30_9BACT